MKPRPGKTALVDTGFWIALLDVRDQHHKEALKKSEVLNNLADILPWPTLYETLNTRLVKRPSLVSQFVSKFLKRPNATIWDDCPYRDAALKETLSEDVVAKHPRSLVDNVLREIIADRSVKISCLFTFNIKDFADVCKRRELEIV